MNSGTTRRDARNAINEAIHDPDFRRRVRRLDADALAEIGYQKRGEEVEFKVVTATHDTYYLALGDTSEEQEEHIDLSQIQGGARALGTASTVGSAGTVSSVPFCILSASSGGSAGTASTRDE